MTITKTNELKEGSIETPTIDLKSFNAIHDPDGPRADIDKYILDLRNITPQEIQEVVSSHSSKIQYSIQIGEYYLKDNVYKGIKKARGLFNQKEVHLWISINPKKLGILFVEEKLDSGEDSFRSSGSEIDLATVVITKHSKVKKIEKNGRVAIENCGIFYMLDHSNNYCGECSDITVEITPEGLVFVYNTH